MRVILLSLIFAAGLNAQAPSRAGSVDDLNKLPEDTRSISLSKASNEMLQALARFKQLNRLSVSASGSTTDDAGLGHIAALTSLTELLLSCERYTDAGLEKLLALTALQELELKHGKFSDAALGKLGKLPLEELDVAFNLTMTGACFNDFPADCPLGKVTLTGCAAFSTAGCKALAGIKNIDEIEMAGTLVTVEGVTALAACTKLKELAIGGEGLNDSVCAAIVQIASLERLEFGQAGVTDAGLSQLAKLRKLHSLRAPLQPVGDVTLAAFKEHPALTVLHLRGARVTAAGLAHLKTMPDLDDVELDRMVVNLEGCKALSMCSQITRLSLEDCSIDDACLDELAKLTGLVHLDLADNPVSAEGVLKLKGLIKLMRLDLTENPAITEDVANKLKETLKDCKISHDKPKR